MDFSRRNLLLGVPALAATALLTPTAAAAASTPQQSPIHIRSRHVVDSPRLPELRVDYPRSVDVRVRYFRRDDDEPDGCSVRDSEEQIQAEVPAGAAAIQLGDRRYELLQFHFHIPAEHVVDGRQFPIEQHYVHRGPDGETLVIGLFLVPGGGATLQDAVLGTRPEECGPERAATGDLADSLPRGLSTFRYDGSLTTDPYSEPVSWLVLEQPREVAAASIEGYRALFPDGDSRELQPLNGRVVRRRRQ